MLNLRSTKTSKLTAERILPPMKNILERRHGVRLKAVTEGQQYEEGKTYLSGYWNELHTVKDTAGGVIVSHWHKENRVTYHHTALTTKDWEVVTDEDV